MRWYKTKEIAGEINNFIREIKEGRTLEEIAYYYRSSEIESRVFGHEWRGREYVNLSEKEECSFWSVCEKKNIQMMREDDVCIKRECVEGKERNAYVKCGYLCVLEQTTTNNKCVLRR